MKKKKILLSAALSLGAAASFAGGAFAEGITTSDGLKDCMEHTELEKAVCVLDDNIVLQDPITVTHEVDLQLSGHVISADDTFTGADKNSMITVNHGATLSIFGTGAITTSETTIYSPIRLTTVDDLDDTKKAILNVDNAILQGFYYGIVGSGNEHRGNTEVNLYGATIQGLNFGDCFGIYHPQLGDLNVYDGTLISGDGGIAIKSGNLNVYGGRIVGDGNLKTTVPYNNGANPTGSALLIESNDNYFDQIKIRITGGELVSKNGYVIDEYKEKDNTVAAVQSFVVEGGKFEGEKGIIRHQSDLGKFIKGGSFNVSIDDYENFIYNYVDETKSYSFDSINQILSIHAKVQPENLPENLTVDMNHKELKEEQKAEAIAALADGIELPSGFNLAQIEEIRVFQGSLQPSTVEEPITFNVLIEESARTPAEGFTRKWYVIRSHLDAGEYVYTFLDATFDPTTGLLSFATDQFSEFYIGYADTELPKAPDTAFAEELTASAIALGSLVALSAAAYVTVKARR